jgi:hypothetical protein
MLASKPDPSLCHAAPVSHGVDMRIGIGQADLKIAVAAISCEFVVLPVGGDDRGRSAGWVGGGVVW